MALRPGQLVLKNVRLSFPHLYVPTKSTEDGALKYRAAFLIDPETAQGKANIKLIDAEIARVKTDKWKDKADKIKLKEDRMAYVNGDDCVGADSGEVYIGYEGMKVLKTANSKRPQVVDGSRQAITEEESEGKIYAGCYVNAVVSLYAINDVAKGGNGIFATVEAVQFSKHGEAFGAAPVDVYDAFDEVVEEDAAEDEV